MSGMLGTLNARCAETVASVRADGKNPPVFGAGRSDRPGLMFVGEAPGEREAMNGVPFVGKAGSRLTYYLDKLGIRRDEIYITNVVKIRPTRMTKGGRTANRAPDQAEVDMFLPFLLEEIAIVKPRLLVTLGVVALKALLSRDSEIKTCHGCLFQTMICPPVGMPWSYPLFALYHPASLIYNHALEAVYDHDIERLACLRERWENDTEQIGPSAERRMIPSSAEMP